MPDYPFLFTLDLPDDARLDEMLRAVATSIVGHMGYRGAAATDRLAPVFEMLRQGAAIGGRACRIQFSVDGGELQISLNWPDGRQWQTRAALP